MGDEETKAKAAKVLELLEGLTIAPNWTGCDPVWMAFERMAKEGACVVIKIDGQRKSEADNGKYTVLVSGGPLRDDFFRSDTCTLEDGLARAILHYAERCWN